MPHTRSGGIYLVYIEIAQIYKTISAFKYHKQSSDNPFSELATEKGNADAVHVHQQFTCLLGFVHESNSITSLFFVHFWKETSPTNESHNLRVGFFFQITYQMERKPAHVTHLRIVRDYADFRGQKREIGVNLTINYLLSWRQ